MAGWRFLALVIVVLGGVIAAGAIIPSVLWQLLQAAARRFRGLA